MPDRGAPVLFVAIVQPGHTAIKRLDVTNSVKKLEFDDAEHMAAKLSLTVDNRSLANFDAPIWRKGGVIEASWGYAGDTTPTYSCVIQSVKGFRELVVEALAKSVLMHTVLKSRKWIQMKRSDVIKAVAAENGYSGDALHVQDSVVVLPYVHQVRETDAALLHRLARAEGYYFSVDYDGLHWHERKTGHAPLREYTWFNDPGRGDIIGEPVIENDVTAKPASVVISGRDPIAKKDFSVTADNDSSPRTGLAGALEIVDPVSGVTSYQPAAGQSTMAPSSDLNAASAMRRAQGQFKDAQMTAVKLTLPVIGDPRVRARSVVKVNGIRSLSGNYYAGRVTDSVSTAGFTQALYLRRDGRAEIFPKAAAPPTVNKKDPNTDTGKLEPVEVVDPISGATKTVYQDARGREQS
jgi:phage protein D